MIFGVKREFKIIIVTSNGKNCYKNRQRSFRLEELGR